MFKLPVLVSIDVNLVDAEEVNVFNELVVLSMFDTLVLLLDVYVLKSDLIELDADSKDVSLPEADDVNVFKLLVVLSITPNLVFVLDVYEFKDEVAVCNVPITVLFELV